MDAKQENYNKIVILSVPLAGHVIPLLELCNELCLKRNIKVIFYSTLNFKQHIEKTGAEFRSYNGITDEDMNIILPIKKRIYTLPSLINRLQVIIDENLIKLAREIDYEKPDAILYEYKAIHAHWPLRLIYENYCKRNNIYNGDDDDNDEDDDIERGKNEDKQSKSNDVIDDDEATSSISESCSDNENTKKRKKTVEKEGTAITFVASSLPPATILYRTSFMNDNELIRIEKQIENNDNQFRLNIDWLKIKLKSFKLCKKYKLKFINAYKEIQKLNENYMNYLNIVFTFPELQPRAHLFDSRVNKFVGSCVHVNVCNNNNDDTSESNNNLSQINTSNHLIGKFLSLFKIKNPFNSLNDIIENHYNNPYRLIYVSLGTFFADNVPIYLKVINAFKSREKKKKIIKNKDEDDDDEEDEDYEDDDINFSNLKLYVIVNVGQTCYDIFNQMLETNELKLAENMIIVSNVDQNEILKRASLFITHSGMISISQSVHYGVPMICIPITVEQSQIASRLTDELGLGINLDFINLKSNYVQCALYTILNDYSYHERCLRYSKISREYNGPKNAADIIENFVKNNKKSKT